MTSLKDCNLEGLEGSVLGCNDCQKATIHFTAPGGVPICAYCGGTPVTPASYVASRRRSLERTPPSWRQKPRGRRQ